MNSTLKIVFSRTLPKAEWGRYDNARLVKEHAAEEINRLKQQPGKNLVIYGSGNLVRSLSELGLIDEYQLLVFPIILGAGKQLFSNLAQPLNLKLVKTEAYKNGVVVLYYQPEGKSA